MILQVNSKKHKTDKTIIYARRRSFWVVILSIKYKLVYDVVKNWPLFGILPVTRLGQCISETGHLDTPVMLGTNKNSRRPMNSWNSSSCLIHLSVWVPPSTSAEDKTHFGFLLQQLPYLLLLSLSQRLFVNAFRPLSAKPWVEGGPRSLPSFGIPRLTLCDVARIECSCARLRLEKVAHCPDSLPIHLPCLTV